MEEFFLEYCIENKYESQVRRANFQLLVLPESTSHQIVKEVKIQASENQDLHRSKNLFGFETLTCYLGKPFTEFWFKLTAKIQKSEINPFLVSQLSPEAEFASLHAPDFQIDNYLFLLATPLTKIAESAVGIFPFYSNNFQLFEYLTELNTTIFQLLEYSPDSTDVNTPVEEILLYRKGVCQDYAHLFISVCRRHNIPARYVSGYLNQGAGFVGTSQLHAWVEALIPELGWVGFDSTNNLLADHHYIKIAHGTDFRDCSPIIGVLESTGTQKSIHSVTVTNQ